MEPLALLGSGGVIGVIGVLGPLLMSRRSEKTKAGHLEAEKIKNSLAGNIELNKYIDERIEKAQAPLREEVDTLRSEVKAVRDRERDTKLIIRRWFQRLTWWDSRGRPGPMPVPAEDDMHLLDLSDIEITVPTNEVMAVQSPDPSPTPEKEEP